MPSYVKYIDLDFEDPTYNQKELNKISKHLYVDRKGSCGGWFHKKDVYGIEYDGKKDNITFFSTHEKFKLDFNNPLGKIVVQKHVWKSSKSKSNLPVTVVFNRYLKLYDTIMTDDIQTVSGKKYWLKLMNIANDLGYSVGFVDVENEYIEFFNGKDVKKWIDEKNAYGGSYIYSCRLFFITNKRL